uniref:Uncharacterized protein n=1 Tax=Spongospora subterranea TaxID=70186 RepID=A0A0H5QYI4_9EUKA|eukprot:CRZ06726.1 hypothetical protein [Spongospora subterranea]
MGDAHELPPSDNVHAQTESESISVASESESNVIAHRQSVMETENNSDWDESIEDAGVVHQRTSQALEPLPAPRFLIQIRRTFPKKGSSRVSDPGKRRWQNCSTIYNQ